MCLPCQQERLKGIYNARRDRAINWAKDNQLKEVVVFRLLAEADEDPRYGYGSEQEPGSTVMEYISIP